MSFLQYSYPNPRPKAASKSLMTATVHYTDTNDLEYTVSVTDLRENTYRVTMDIDRTEAELAPYKKKDRPSGINKFHGTVRIRASRKFYQQPIQAVLTLHELNDKPNEFKANSNNTTKVSPKSSPLDLLRFFFEQGTINPSQDEYVAKEIFIDGYELNAGSINYSGLYLSMEHIINPPNNIANDYSRMKKLNIIEDEVWYLRSTLPEITNTILDATSSPPNRLYNNPNEWRRFLQATFDRLSIIPQSDPLFVSIAGFLSRKTTIKYYDSSSLTNDFYGNIFQALGKWSTADQYWVGDVMNLDPNIRINFDTEKFGLIPNDMNGSTSEEKSAALSFATAGMDSILGFLDLHSEINCEIQGHTDRQGEPGYDNATLSLNRALSVQAYFLTQGLEPSRILRVVGLGSAACDAADFPDTDSPPCRKITVLFFN